MALES